MSEADSFIRQSKLLHIANEPEYIYTAVEKFYLSRCPNCKFKSIVNKITVGIEFDNTGRNQDLYPVPRFASELEFDIFSKSSKKFKSKLSKSIKNSKDFKFSEFKASCQSCMYNFFAKLYRKEYSEYSVNDTMFYNHLTKKMIYFLGNSDYPDKEYFVENISLTQALEIYSSLKLLF